MGVVNSLSMFFIGLAFAVAMLSFSNNFKIAKIFPLIFFISIYKVFYYFLVNSSIPLSIDFLNREGRFIVFLLIVLSLALQRSSIKGLSLFVRWGLVSYAAWLLVFFAHMLNGRQLIDGSHHQIGLTALSGLVLAMLPARLPSEKRILRFLIVVAAMLALFWSGSRISLLAGVFLLLGSFWWRLGGIARTSVVVCVFLVLLLTDIDKFNIGNRTYDLNSFSYVAQGISYGIEHAEEIEKAYSAKEAEIKGGDFNIIARAVVYGKAIKYFMESPLVGIGEGRFDDDSICNTELPLVCIHNQGESDFDGNSAHNAYFHTLAEEGILGFLFVVFVFFNLRKRIIKRRNLLKVSGFNLATISSAGWIFLFSALFHHVLASPLYAITFVVPFFLIANIRT